MYSYDVMHNPISENLFKYILLNIKINIKNWKKLIIKENKRKLVNKINNLNNFIIFILKKY